MMPGIKRRIAVVTVLLVGTLTPLPAAEPAALAFIDEMLGGVRATTRACAPTVEEATTSHGMDAICADFDGSFEAFQTRWDDHSLLAPAHGAEAQTGWRVSSGNHERIYAVGKTVIGVRFSRGEILLVYK